MFPQLLGYLYFLSFVIDVGVVVACTIEFRRNHNISHRPSGLQSPGDNGEKITEPSEQKTLGIKHMSFFYIRFSQEEGEVGGG